MTSSRSTVVVLKVAGLWLAVPFIVALAVAQSAWEGVCDLLERPQ